MILDDVTRIVGLIKIYKAVTIANSIWAQVFLVSGTVLVTQYQSKNVPKGLVLCIDEGECLQTVWASLVRCR